MKDLIAYCGLDCENCQARIATVKNDEALREKVALEWSALNGVTITPDMINCEGCRVGGVKTPYCDKLCPIRQCALQSGHATCGRCAELDTCRKVGAIFDHNPDAKRNLTPDHGVEIIEIIGDNYDGKWNKTRVACRGIVIEDGKILLSYMAASDFWMIPGGGLEDGEDEAACCVRELAEETGVCVELSPCVLEIDEYYRDRKYITLYFFGSVVGSCDRKPTADEVRSGMVPRRLPVKEAIAVFAQYADRADLSEIKCGVYQREYAALRRLSEQGKIRL